ncbi:MAG: zf-HC2 domain-containing protein [Acidobacteria bacterium]|nr:zf-HC2 domain-containing protein [Acidobacteriota bacterium]
MKVTKDVILDLLPLYQEGEVSADSRRLVEEYLSQDPELKERVKVSGVQVSARTLVGRELDDALSAMEKAKAALRYQKWMQF